MSESTDRLITAILPQGEGAGVLKALFDRGFIRASLGTARAPIPVTRRRGGFARTALVSVEKDIITVVATAAEADEAFSVVHEAGRISERPGGFVFMGRLARASQFSLPPTAGT